MHERQLFGEFTQVEQGEAQAAHRAGELLVGELIEVYPFAHWTQTEALKHEMQLEGQFMH
jgi:hypothetical protein